MQGTQIVTGYTAAPQEPKDPYSGSIGYLPPRAPGRVPSAAVSDFRKDAVRRLAADPPSRRGGREAANGRLKDLEPMGGHRVRGATVESGAGGGVGEKSARFGNWEWVVLESRCPGFSEDSPLSPDTTRHHAQYSPPHAGPFSLGSHFGRHRALASGRASGAWGPCTTCRGLRRRRPGPVGVPNLKPGSPGPVLDSTFWQASFRIPRFGGLGVRTNTTHPKWRSKESGLNPIFFTKSRVCSSAPPPPEYSALC